MQPGSTKQRRRVRVGTALTALLVAIGTQSPAYARKDYRNRSNEPAPQVQRELARPHAGVSLDKIITATEKRYGASVVKVEDTVLQGRRAYVLRLHFKDGRIVHIKVDAETGKEL